MLLTQSAQYCVLTAPLLLGHNELTLPVGIVFRVLSLSLCKCSILNTFLTSFASCACGVLCLLLKIRGRRFLRKSVTMLHAERCHVSASFEGVL